MTCERDAAPANGAGADVQKTASTPPVYAEAGSTTITLLEAHADFCRIEHRLREAGFELEAAELGHLRAAQRLRCEEDYVHDRYRRDVERCRVNADDSTMEALEALSDGTPPVSIEDRDFLRAHLREIVPDRLALGAFPRRDDRNAPIADEWFREDPSRLARVVTEMRRFTADERRVAEAGAALARELGLEEEAAVEAIATGLRAARDVG